MKTTVDLPDDLLIEAKKYAAEHRLTLRILIERGLRQQVSLDAAVANPKKPVIRWVTVEGGSPPGLDMSDREKMMEFLRRDRR